MKRPGERVKLRVAWGEVPRAGSVLCMPSGRRYWVTMANGKTLHCRVMAPGDPIPEIAVAVLEWRWGSGKPRVRTGKSLAQQIGEACAA